MHSHHAMTMHKERFRRPQQSEVGALLRPVFDDFHLLRMEGSYEYPRHQHTNYEVILIERGPYRCELNGTELTLVDGQTLIIKPGDVHQDHLGDGQRHYVLHFRLLDPETGTPGMALFRPDVCAGEQVCRGDCASETWFLAELRREAEEGGDYAGAVQDSLMEALFWRLVRGLDPAALSLGMRQLPAAAARREEIAEAMARHVAGNPTVGELAAALGVSPRHLTNQCVALFGRPPARLLLQLKVRRAEELLHFRAQRVREVSDALGFANPYHFSRVFSRLRGYPPSQWSRSQARQLPSSSPAG
ncbi:MAG TPA: AraC family transcriptional regulator [Opitutaceae bacterium]|nr:AraC family transcriptional regulator [Opitutaceae bacterium]